MSEFPARKPDHAETQSFVFTVSPMTQEELDAKLEAMALEQEAEMAARAEDEAAFYSSCNPSFGASW